eukprot:3212452-Pleurochrysis_carterae.AAC.1
MSALAHFSPGVARGRAFIPFECPCCSYSPSEEDWRAEVREHECFSDAERAHGIADHNEIGKSDH